MFKLILLAVTVAVVASQKQEPISGDASVASAPGFPSKPDKSAPGASAKSAQASADDPQAVKGVKLMTKKVSVGRNGYTELKLQSMDRTQRQYYNQQYDRYTVTFTVGDSYCYPNPWIYDQSYIDQSCKINCNGYFYQCSTYFDSDKYTNQIWLTGAYNCNVVGRPANCQ